MSFLKRLFGIATAAGNRSVSNTGVIALTIDGTDKVVIPASQ